MSSPKEPQFPQFTNLDLTGALGTGLFDQLMGTVKHHLLEEYKKQRITGQDYAGAVVTSMGNVMQVTTQYLLGTVLIEQQKAESEARTSLTEAQKAEVESKMELIDLEREKLRFQIDFIYPLEKQKLESEIANLVKQGELIDKQIDKITAEIAHMLAQQELWDRQEEKILAEIAQLTASTALTLEQIDKIAAEIALINAKTSTEDAQLNDHPGNGGLMGKQKDLLTAQKLGFAGDLYMKSAKMYADYTNTVIAIYEPITEAGDEYSLDPGATSAASSAQTIAGTIAGI